MLEPQQRLLLVDGVAPPPGMQLDRAVGTTFTLDLISALAVPLALAGRAAERDLDPIAVMESVRRLADRFDLFCQAGALTPPAKQNDLLALLEPVLHEVIPPPGFLFHPKVWILRYVGEDDETAFRLLVGSRNLTGDHSWDAVVRLDGIPGRRLNAGNTPIARLLGALLDSSRESLPADRRDAIEELAEDVRRVEWELPDGADEIVFHAFGVPGGARARLDELLEGYSHAIVSPFVTADWLERVVAFGRGTVTVVSRPEELDKLPASIGAGHDVRFFRIGSLLEAGDDDDEATPVDPDEMLAGLHAKVYVVEANRRARVLIGSANATMAGFGGNVEFLCELGGGWTRLGCEKLLSDDGMGRMLEPYAFPSQPADTSRDDAIWRLDRVLFDLANLDFTVTMRAEGDAFGVGVTTSAAAPGRPDDVAVHLSPYDQAADRHPVTAAAPIDIALHARPAADVTPFLLLTASAPFDGGQLVRSTCVRAALRGAPADRVDEILIRQLDTPEKFWRFVALLLGLADEPLAAPGDTGTEPAAGAWQTGLGPGLLEMLVRAVATQPDALDQLVDMVERIDRSGRAAAVLPAGWDRVWPAVVQAHTALQKRAR